MTQLALGTEQGRGRQRSVLRRLGLMRRAGLRLEWFQEPAGLLPFVMVGRTPQSIGTDFDKALGQDVPQEAPDKFLGAHPDVLGLLRLVVPITESDFSVFKAFQPTVADG